ncbi:hypothetical protein FKM82_029446 [Ascaphus truei]
MWGKEEARERRRMRDARPSNTSCRHRKSASGGNTRETSPGKPPSSLGTLSSCLAGSNTVRMSSVLAARSWMHTGSVVPHWAVPIHWAGARPRWPLRSWEMRVVRYCVCERLLKRARPSGSRQRLALMKRKEWSPSSPFSGGTSDLWPRW